MYTVTLNWCGAVVVVVVVRASYALLSTTSRHALIFALSSTWYELKANETSRHVHYFFNRFADREVFFLWVLYLCTLPRWIFFFKDISDEGTRLLQQWPMPISELVLENCAILLPFLPFEKKQYFNVLRFYQNLICPVHFFVLFVESCTLLDVSTFEIYSLVFGHFGYRQLPRAWAIWQLEWRPTGLAKVMEEYICHHM